MGVGEEEVELLFGEVGVRVGYADDELYRIGAGAADAALSGTGAVIVEDDGCGSRLGCFSVVVLFNPVDGTAALDTDGPFGLLLNLGDDSLVSAAGVSVCFVS
jgi:hypothetical protein